ncbi:MAG: glycosyltransferase family 1 protein [Ferruginibacter sp.]
MKLGYDGKRAFQNETGLGNYSRSLVAILAQRYPQHDYTLFAPKKTDLFNPAGFDNVHAVFPETVVGKKISAWWRRYHIVKAIEKAGIDIYHGLSNELPLHIERTPVKSIVTIHDLIFERFPETYHYDEQFTYRWKIKRACKKANAIIAISQQTKDDLINLYGVNANKISICYQSCNPIFERTCTQEEKELIKQKYNLPDDFFLFVSSIAPRKNLSTVCKALVSLKEKLHIPLVVIGNGKKEKAAARSLMNSNGMADRLILLNEMPISNDPAFMTAADFPAIYQQATALIYPSLFEGFGLPVLEALWSRLPVICSNISSLPEVAGDAALYFSPADYESLAAHMMDIATHPQIADALKDLGYKQAQKFTPATYAGNIMEVYNKVMGI